MPSAKLPFVEAALVAATAAMAYVYFAERRARRKAEDAERRAEDNRQAERKGRIRAEIKLREHMKQSNATSAAAAAAATANEKSTKGEDDAYMHHNIDCIGRVVSPFTKRMGTPRQGSLAPNARGYVQLVGIPEQTIEGFSLYSHAWVIFAFHANTDLPSGSAYEKVKKKTKIRPPRAPKGLKVGMLATRSPHRPNNIGLSLVKVDGVDAKKKRLYISALDLVNGTPVYDIKPVVPWDIPRDLTVPEWVDQEDEIANVEFSTNAKSQLESCVKEGCLWPHYTIESGNNGAESAALALGEILCQDPRAANKRGSASSSDPYRIVFGKSVVEFMGGVNGITVTSVKRAKIVDGAMYVDGIPLLGIS